jgi:hypothetical protein
MSDGITDMMIEQDGKLPLYGVFETYTIEQLIEEERVLNADIEAATQRLSNVENELFYRSHSECKRS